MIALPTRPLPTKRDEAFRYADLDALADVWPTKQDRYAVPSGEGLDLCIVMEGATPISRDLEIDIEQGAQCRLHLLNSTDAYGRFQLRVILGEGADFEFGAVQVGGGDQKLEIVTEIIHEEPNATSRQTVRSVLAGQATGTYLGKVAVARGAVGTDSEQSVRAMLLSRTATANAKPELEIYADDVKCAHGCAVGELDASALFYLQSHGLPPEEARKLMLQAFVAEAFSGAADEERLLALALGRLGELV